MSRLQRLPIRVRVTLALAGVMAVVLGGVGLFVYERLQTELDVAIEDVLRTRAGDVITLVQQPGSGLAQSGRSPLAEEGENLAQILDPGGSIVDTTPSLRNRPLLAGPDLRRATRGTIFVTRTTGDGAARVLATPVTAQGRAVVVLVATPLEDRDDAVRSLGALLLVGGPVALLLAALTGFGALTVALRPVDSMRRQAAAIDDAADGRRLPVPPADDEVRRLGETLNAMLDRLETAFARERTFVADAGHELRTPLSILKAELELALRDGRSPDELRAALRSAAEETDRLVQLAEDLLVIARSDQGRLPVQTTPVDPGALLRVVEARFAARAAEHGVALTVVAPEGLSLVADGPALEQALGNLVDNALRHGGGEVTLGVAADGADVVLRVGDDGPGFPAAFVDQAFERFSRADAARSRGGAGLGLAIVAAIAEAHGGTATVTDRDAGGAEITLRLPAGGPGVTQERAA